jgi:hypothetical protein
MTRTLGLAWMAPLLAAGVALCAPTVGAQVAGANSNRPASLPAQDPTARLREVLPADVADRVIARIAEARAKGLAAGALEQRALKFAARGVAPAQIERSITEQAVRQERAADVLKGARAVRASGDEIDAAAEAMRQGVDGKTISALASSAPSGRSLAVPLAVLGELQDRGLPSDEALARVRERLQARATDRELAELPAAGNGNGLAKGRPADAGKPALTGRDLAATKRPAAAGGAGNGNGAGGPPAGIPAAPGNGKGKAPVTPPGKGKGGRPPAP